MMSPKREAFSRSALASLRDVGVTVMQIMEGAPQAAMIPGPGPMSSWRFVNGQWSMVNGQWSVVIGDTRWRFVDH
jgi:hypothetical protein